MLTNHPTGSPEYCKICHAETRAFGENLIMGKHTASYRRCVSCGFLFVEQPHWLPEAYSDAHSVESGSKFPHYQGHH
jgi:hypothetical protein